MEMIIVAIEETRRAARGNFRAQGKTFISPAEDFPREILRAPENKNQSHTKHLFILDFPEKNFSI